jgi:hypothetical protein
VASADRVGVVGAHFWLRNTCLGIKRDLPWHIPSLSGFDPLRIHDVSFKYG